MTYLHAGGSEGVLPAHQLIRTTLAIGGEIGVFQVVAGEAMVASGVGASDDGESVAGGGRFMCTSLGANPCGCVDGIVERKFHVPQVGTPVYLLFVEDHCQHVTHGAVEALNSAIARWDGKRSSRLLSCLE